MHEDVFVGESGSRVKIDPIIGVENAKEDESIEQRFVAFGNDFESILDDGVEGSENESFVFGKGIVRLHEREAAVNESGNSEGSNIQLKRGEEGRKFPLTTIERFESFVASEKVVCFSNQLDGLLIDNKLARRYGDRNGVSDGS